MNDSKKTYSAPKASSPKPQWMQPDDDQPIVGRVVAVGAGTSAGDHATSKQSASELPASELPATKNGETEEVNPANGGEPLGRIGRSKLAILTTVFVVAGVLGVPLILYSPVFSKIEKAFWSILATIYSGVLLYILYRVVLWFLAQF